MSVEDLKKYGQMCAEKDDIRAKAKEIGIENVDGQIAYAKGLGLEFSKQDMEDLAKESGISGKDELSEEDLEKVAGGAATTTTFVAISAALAAGSAAAAVSKRW